ALRPVDVLEDEDRRLNEPDAFEKAARREEQQQALRNLVVAAEAQEQCDVSEGLGCFRLGHQPIDRNPQLLARNGWRVRLENARRFVDEARERLIPDLLLVRKTAPTDDPAAATEHLRSEVPAETRLSDPG